MTDGLCVRRCSSRDIQPAAPAAAYFGFGELEEALIHGGGASASTGGCVDPGVITRSDVAAQTKRKLLLGSCSSSLSEPRLHAKKALGLAFVSRLAVHSAAQGETCLAFWRPCWFPFLYMQQQHSVQQLQRHCIHIMVSMPMPQRWKHHVYYSLRWLPSLLYRI